MLRVHGVNGWSSTEVLQASDIVQVAGDDLSGFYRRMRSVRAGDGDDIPAPLPEAAPGPGTTLEAYDWGLFSSQRPAQAFWLLLMPFALVNLAGWMLPKGDDEAKIKTRLKARAEARVKAFRAPRYFAATILRVLALSLTLEFMLATVGVTVGVVGEQCGTAGLCRKTPAIPLSWLPSVVSFFGLGSVKLPDQRAHRLVFTFLATLLVLVGLWQLCWLTRRRYEQWTSASRPPTEDAEPELHHHAFWRGDERVLRLSILHSAAILGLLTCLVDSARGTVLALRIAGIAVIVVCATLVCFESLVGLAVHSDDGETAQPDPIFGRGLLILLALVAAWIFTAALVLLWNTTIPSPVDLPHARKEFLPGWSPAMVAVWVIQLALCVVLPIVVAVGRNTKASDAATGWRPFAGGYASAGTAALGAGLAAVLTAVAVTTAEVVLTIPVSGDKGVNAKDPTQGGLPRIFQALDAGALIFAAIAVVTIVVTVFVQVIVRQRKKMWKQVVADLGVAPPANHWRRHFQIWRDYAIARSVDPLFSSMMVGGWLGALGGSVAAALVAFGAFGFLADSDQAGVASGSAAALGLFLIGLLRSEQNNPDQRRTIGVIWDVATFWPRAAHPFSPPSYGERAVPELTMRLKYLLENKSKVLLVGYSQGLIIAFAALAQLSPEDRARITFLTVGCPLRRLYGCGFPHYFGYHQFKLLRENELRPDWVNVWRATDYIGGWISSSSHDRPANTTIGTVDVWIADPVSYAPVPGDNSVSIVNLHSDYFPDPLVADEVRRLLATMT